MNCDSYITDYLILHKPYSNFRCDNDTFVLAHVRHEELSSYLLDIYTKGKVYFSAPIGISFTAEMHEDIINHLFKLNYMFSYNGIVCMSETNLVRDISEYVSTFEFATKEDRLKTTMERESSVSNNISKGIIKRKDPYKIFHDAYSRPALTRETNGLLRPDEVKGA